MSMTWSKVAARIAARTVDWPFTAEYNIFPLDNNKRLLYTIYSKGGGYT